ncbi:MULTISPECIES: hypothetical protein [Kitasatospora]|uniref:Uncharacterized protein n=1 Tax=Kitasatospora herbaricolor TaxID=68217 RepID=A0ABZ1W5W9_9ACTN|nr:hypothetical protein [Kitasatospora herbaricolor]
MTSIQHKSRQRSTRPATTRRPKATIPPRRKRRPRPKPVPVPQQGAVTVYPGRLRPVRPTAQRIYEIELFGDLE